MSVLVTEAALRSVPYYTGSCESLAAVLYIVLVYIFCPGSFQPKLQYLICWNINLTNFQTYVPNDFIFSVFDGRVNFLMSL